MPSLQLLQLTKHGRGFLASRRKSLLLATGVFVAGGAALYMQSRLCHKWPDSFGHSCAGPGSLTNDSETGINKPTVHTGKRAKKSGLRSLQVLVAILLSRMGKRGARDLLYLVSVVVLRTAVSNRLAKVQGFLFRAAFLRRVPTFLRLIIENVILCFLLSTFHSTSKYITGTISLRFRKILTKIIHTHYFEKRCAMVWMWLLIMNNLSR